MLPIASSSMAIFRFGFSFFLLICCIMTITSYRIDHRPYEGRHERAVTEWRFRRNFLLPFVYYSPNNADEHMPNNEAVENENENEMQTYEKKYIPKLLFESNNNEHI